MEKLFIEYLDICQSLDSYLLFKIGLLLVVFNLTLIKINLIPLGRKTVF